MSRRSFQTVSGAKGPYTSVQRKRLPRVLGRRFIRSSEYVDGKGNVLVEFLYARKRDEASRLRTQGKRELFPHERLKDSGIRQRVTMPVNRGGNRRGAMVSFTWGRFFYTNQRTRRYFGW